MNDFYFALLNSEGRALLLFSFDHTPTDGQMPDPSRGQVVQLSLEEYEDWTKNMPARAWVNGLVSTVPSNAVYSVPRMVIINRLSAVGKLRAAYTMLKLDEPLSSVSDDELVLRELWRSDAPIYSNSVSVRALLDQLDLGAVNSSTDAILAAP